MCVREREREREREGGRDRERDRERDLVELRGIGVSGYICMCVHVCMCGACMRVCCMCAHVCSCVLMCVCARVWGYLHTGEDYFHEPEHVVVILLQEDSPLAASLLGGV